MPALLLRAHETDTNAWYPVATSQPLASVLSVDSAAALTPIINSVEKVPNLCYMSKSSCEQGAGGTRNDEAGSGAKEMDCSASTGIRLVMKEYGD